MLQMLQGNHLLLLAPKVILKDNKKKSKVEILTRNVERFHFF